MKCQILITAMLLMFSTTIGQTTTEHIQMGKAKMSAQEYQAALDHFQIAISMEADHAEAYYLSGKVRSILGDFMKAGGDFRKAMQLDPTIMKKRSRKRAI